MSFGKGLCEAWGFYLYPAARDHVFVLLRVQNKISQHILTVRSCDVHSATLSIITVKENPNFVTLPIKVYLRNRQQLKYGWNTVNSFSGSQIDQRSYSPTILSQSTECTDRLANLK